MQEHGHLIGLQIGLIRAMCVCGWLPEIVGRRGGDSTFAKCVVEICGIVNWAALGILLTIEYIQKGLVHLLIVEFCLKCRH